MGWNGVTLKRCPSCNSDGLTAAGRRVDGTTVSVCVRCGLGILNPMPTELELGEMYKDYFRRSDGYGYCDYPTSLRSAQLDFLLLDMIKRFGRSGPRSLLDVGCAYGARVAFFQRQGFRAAGVDISEEAAAYGRTKWNLDLRAARFEDFASETTFDAITMIDFIEHLPEPMSWIRKVSSLTHRDSLLLILTPDFDCYSSYGERWIGYNMSLEHVLFYNRRSLRFIFERFGFEVLFESNVKSLPPTVDAPAPTPKRMAELGRVMMKLNEFGVGKSVIEWGETIMHRINWPVLLSEGSIENSLFVIARKSEPP